MKKFLGYILSPLSIVSFLLVLIIFQPMQWFSYKFMGYAAHKKVVDVMNFFLFSTYYFTGNSVTFINNQPLPVGRSIIFVANHQSMFDIAPLIWFLRKYHAKFISKIELTKGIPSISFNLKYGGGANIDRKDPRQAITEIAKLGTRMKENNWSAIIFPEGTRSLDGQVNTFQTAGVAAILKKCPDALVVPVAISNSWKAVRYGMYPLNTFQKIKFEVLPPIEPAGIPIADLVKTIEDRIKVTVH